MFVIRPTNRTSIAQGFFKVMLGYFVSECGNAAPNRE